LGALFIALAVLIALDVSFLQNFDDKVARAAFNFSAGRDGFVSVLKTMEWLFGGTTSFIALGLAAAYVAMPPALACCARSRSC